MKAVYFEKHGGPEVLTYGEFKDPAVGPGDVLVGVKACALNHLDIWVRQGLPGIPIPLPHISGTDVAGVVAQCGPGVSRLRKGDRVVLSPGILPPTAPEAREGRDSYSPEFRVLGLQTQGGYAERIAVPEYLAIPVSEKYSFEEWASLPLAILTAYHMLVTRAQLRAGETVLVHAAGSGIGSQAVQLAKFLGARVFTTVGHPDKAARAQKLGADEVILYRSENFAEKAKQLTGGRGVDVVFEHIGPETWPQNLSCLARGGRMVTCGATSGPKTEVDIRFLFSKQLSILGCYVGSRTELAAALGLAEKGVLKPVVDRIFALREAAEAQRRMESRGNFGKILLKT